MRELLEGGYPTSTPVVVAYQASWPEELVVPCTIETLEETVKEHRLWKHTLFLVGPALDAHGTRSYLCHPGHFHGYRKADPAARKAVLRPPSLVVGVGASRGAPVDEVLGLVEGALRDAGLSVRSVAELATVDAKAGEPGIVGAAGRLGVPLVTYTAEELAGVSVPTPSDAPLAAVGTPSVAEAAALVRGGELLVPKRKSRREDGRPAMATCAVVRRPARGRLAVVGLGPGARDLLTPRARAELRRASVLVGLDQYVDQIRDLPGPGTRILQSGLGAEEERARRAVAETRWRRPR